MSERWCARLRRWRQHCDCAQRCFGAASDLHRQREYAKSPSRELAELREVLEGRYVGGEENAMGFEECGPAAVDARGVETDGVNSTFGGPVRSCPVTSC